MTYIPHSENLLCHVEALSRVGPDLPDLLWMDHILSVAMVQHIGIPQLTEERPSNRKYVKACGDIPL